MPRHPPPPPPPPVSPLPPPPGFDEIIVTVTRRATIMNAKATTKIRHFEIVRALDLFCVGITEIRLLKCQANYGAPFIVSGYFDRQHFHDAANELNNLDAVPAKRMLFHLQRNSFRLPCSRIQSFSGTTGQYDQR